MRYVDDSQPGWVECRLTDANGRGWTFVEKVPVVTDADLDGESAYPRLGLIACDIITRDDRVVRVDTTRPWGIESVDGQTQFDVPPHLIVERG